MIFGTAFTSSDPHPSLGELAAERAIGITHKRLTIDLAKLCASGPDPTTWLWPDLDSLVANLRAAGMTIYFNPSGCPAWASEGQPAFVGLIPGTSWWNAPDAKNPVTGLPDPFPHGIHYFDQNPSRTDTRRDDATGQVYSGAELAAIDQQQPPRPYLTNPPKMSADFFRTVGVQLSTRYDAALVGVGNEYGGEMFNPWVRLDVARDGTVDMIREHLGPEMIAPFFSGFDQTQQRIGPDADSDDIMQRCLDAGLQYDILAGHCYGDFDGMSYATTKAFLKVANGRTLWCTEINAATSALFDWTTERVANADVGAIFYLRPGMFFDGDGYALPHNPKVSAIGTKFTNLIASVNKPLAPDPLVTAMPAPKRDEGT
jgi:hypothetical protein